MYIDKLTGMSIDNFINLDDQKIDHTVRVNHMMKACLCRWYPGGNAVNQN